MNFDWEEFLRVAKRHIGQEEYPAKSAKDRCAISRAYYAAFHITRKYIEGQFPDAPIGNAGDMHHKMPKWLVTPDDARLALIGDLRNDQLAHVGELLERMRKSRRIADYENEDPPRLWDSARDTVLNCDDVIGIVNSL